MSVRLSSAKPCSKRSGLHSNGRDSTRSVSKGGRRLARFLPSVGPFRQPADSKPLNDASNQVQNSTNSVELLTGEAISLNIQNSVCKYSCGQTKRPQPITRPGAARFLGKLLGRFFFDDDLHVRGDIFVQLHRHVEFAHRLQRFMQLDLAAIDVETLLLESLGDVA